MTGPATVIGVDVGTTAVKVVAFGLTDPTLRVAASREYPLTEPQPGWHAQDPELMVAGTLAALAEVVAGLGGGPVVGLSLSTAMHGLIGLAADGRPLTPLLTWADARARDEARALRTSGEAATLHTLTGTPVHPMTPLTKLMWFARNEPSLCATVRHWVGLKDHLVRSLTGSLVTELSSASATGMLDVATRTWSPVAIELAGVRAEQLPQILSPTASLPLAADVAARVGLPAGLPVVLGAADGPLGNLGTGAVTPGVAALSLGTSGAVRAAVDRPLIDPLHRLFTYALTEQVWVVGGAVSNGASVVRWAREVFGGDDDAALLAAAAIVAPGSDGLTVLPFLLPERAPLWDPDLTGTFLGVRAAHRAPHFVRATVEGVALQLAGLVRDVARVADVAQVTATGGALAAPLWRDTLAAALPAPLVIGPTSGGTALGAAALGVLALGRAPSLLAALRSLQPDEPVQPVAADPLVRAALDGVRARVDEVWRAAGPAVDLLAHG